MTGVSGSGKTTLVLESLVPALEARIDGKTLPPHVRALDAEGIAHVKLIDATPSGSTSAPPLPPTQASTMICAGSLRGRRTQRHTATKPEIFPTTPGPCAVPAATAPAR